MKSCWSRNSTVCLPTLYINQPQEPYTWYFCSPTCGRKLQSSRLAEMGLTTERSNAEDGRVEYSSVLPNLLSIVSCSTCWLKWKLCSSSQCVGKLPANIPYKTTGCKIMQRNCQQTTLPLDKIYCLPLCCGRYWINYVIEQSCPALPTSVQW